MCAAMWSIALLLLSTADALTSDRSGPSFDLAAGGSFLAPPVLGGVSGFASLGWWDGNYDDSYAIGRYWSAQLNGRVDYLPAADLRIAPTFEVRRGLDLVVVGWYVGGGGGPLLVPTDDGLQIGAGGRLAFGAEFRRTRFLGFTARIEAGADVVGGAVAGCASMMLGGQFSRPGDGRGVD